ncbi:flagellar brake domain-containing protein [Gracilibacillus sp. S3-1-1]|uniref:Flagellar brake domain-containing protein n=1 Tax=Gracilibacillus pellucidus TaxID=3095368 RepID=A0ACC6M5M1_9BACI|nr:flagellar brake domain-containing protein [Gracilibacillus sp. S3-1-1]MDX8046102.1 flagellar brake domain-containing protein [Gracilibacillus sp. S3-1-1]
MIKIGTLLQLEQMDVEHDIYKSKVVDAKDGRIYIDYPANDGLTSFTMGTVFQVHFIEMNSVYSFPTEVIGKTKLNNVPVLILSFQLDNLTKIQRREFVRVKAFLDVSIQSVEEKFDPFTTVTYDISGGGLGVLLDNNFSISQGELLDIMLVLPVDKKLEYIHTIGEAVRIDESTEEKNLLSVKFNEIDQKDQQFIVQYCYTKQLEERRRGFS